MAFLAAASADPLTACLNCSPVRSGAGRRQWCPIRRLLAPGMAAAAGPCMLTAALGMQIDARRAR
jgi:hypothetical protein